MGVRGKNNSPTVAPHCQVTSRGAAYQEWLLVGRRPLGALGLSWLLYSVSGSGVALGRAEALATRTRSS